MKTFEEFKLNEIAPADSNEEHLYRELGMEFCIALKKQIELDLPMQGFAIFCSTLQEIFEENRLSRDSFDGHADYVTSAEVIGEVLHMFRGNISTKKFGV